MKDLKLNEILRYLAGGVFMIALLYFSTDKEILKENLETLGKTEVFGIFTLLSFTIGTILYVFNRALVFPMFNTLISWVMIKKYSDHKPFEGKSAFFAAATSIDIARTTSKKESIKSLSEWAGQVHFLYVIAISLFIIILVGYTTCTCYFTSIDYACCYLVLALTSAVFHHVRYKIFELILLTTEPPKDKAKTKKLGDLDVNV